MQTTAFLIFLIVFMTVGFLSTRGRKSNSTEYLLADRETPAILVALSAAATKYSGYMYIGLIGYIYTFGLSAIWIVLGFITGDAIALFTVQKKLRQETARTNALSFADLISRWHYGDYRKLKLAIGIVSLVFLSTYAAAQFNAGGKALQALFGWDYRVGSALGALFILSYSLTGGLRASIWTDVVQSVVMIVVLAMLFSAVLNSIGGTSEWLAQLATISPSYLDLGYERFGSITALLLFASGWLFNGIGVVGQPHIMVRLMAMNPSASSLKAGIYYFFWSALFLALVIAVGLSTRLVLGDLNNFDAELALPHPAQALLPSLAVGVMLAGIFAAVMSTTDSQILSCSAVLSEDFKIARSVTSKRLVTLVVTCFSLMIALFASSNVFTLVVFAWSALATAIAPLVIVHALGQRPSENLALTMMAAGLATGFIWRSVGLSSAIYECLPGILAGLLVFLSGSFLIPTKTSLKTP